MSKRNRQHKTKGSNYAQEVMSELEADGPFWSVIKDKYGPCGLGSSKIQAILNQIRAIPKTDKILIFSSWTSALDLIAAGLDGEQPRNTDNESGPKSKELEMGGGLFSGVQSVSRLSTTQNSNKIGYVLLDGDTKDRTGVIRQFKQDPSCQVLLMTYKVGSTGLNLTDANHVIRVENWWTYSVSDQADARVWRPGQTKPVTVYEFLVQHSIELHVRSICEQKREMEQTYLSNTSTLAETVTKETNRLNATMLRRILG